jgi:hypothetical protein
MLSFASDHAAHPLLPTGGAEELAPPFQAVLSINMPTESFIHFDLQTTTWCGQPFDAGFDVRVASFIEDLLEVDSGWTAGAGDDDATAGAWVRGDPIGTWREAEAVQPEDDHTPEGIACFVTGQGDPGQSANYSDVDGGKTTLLSPVFNLTTAVEPRLVYWRWYTNNLAQFPNEEVWQVDVSSDGGTSWTTLEHTTASDNQWQRVEFVLTDYIDLTAAVRLRFVASDYGYDSLVEAAIDDVSIESLPALEAADENAPWTPQSGLGRIAPNPLLLTSGVRSVAIEFAVPKTGNVDLRIFDVSGALIRNLCASRRDAGVHQVAWDGRDTAGRPVPAGMYFIRFRTAGEADLRKVALLR